MRYIIPSMVIIFSFSFFPLAFADRGMIPISPNVSVYEPGQKAIIAWNKGKEILILSTDVRANGETKVLEVVPLPSVPKIEKGDFKSFESIQRLINMNVPLFDRGKEGVEIIFHEKIGAHDITVTKANDFSDFIKWAKDFTGQMGLTFPPELKSIILDYIEDGMRYFVFDVISLKKERKSVDPIIYQFEAPYPFYPLKISTLISGDTEIDLFIITETPLTELYGERVGKFEFGHYIPSFLPILFKVPEESLKEINPNIASLFPGGAWLQVLNYTGELKELTEDLKIQRASNLTGVFKEGKCTTRWGRLK